MFNKEVIDSQMTSEILVTLVSRRNLRILLIIFVTLADVAGEESKHCKI
jgi:hypothetical protein